MPKVAVRTRARQRPRKSGRRGLQMPGVLERAARVFTELTGSAWAFGIAAAVVLVWGATGPLFGYSDTWQLVINTGTTIVTFLMVFLIQRSQNKESRAVQLKLNEIVAALEGASNRLIDVESLSERDLDVLRTHYTRLGELAARDADPARSHSVEEAERRHERKRASA
jgi:low affinity Fe/Cu permease